MLPTIGIRVDVLRSKKEPKKGLARVLDINKEQIIIDMPFTEFGNHVLLFDQDDEIAISYLLNDGAVYSFTTKVLRNRLTVDNLQAISIKVPEMNAITRVQRREFVRVPIRADISFMYLSKNQHPIELRTGEGFTWDVSGGGLSFYSNSPFSIRPEDAISVKFRFPNEPRDMVPIHAKGTVVRLYESKETNVTIVSVRFDSLARAMEQRIVQYVFKRQIELKNKGVENYT